MSSRLSTHVLPAALLFAAAACGDAAITGQDAEPAQMVQALPRALTPGELKLVTAANDFAFSFLGQVSAAQGDSNVFTSPLGASMALGMTMNGAANATYTQMRS